MTEISILWFRQDLRLQDQAALRAAAREGPVVPVYVLDDVTPGRWAIGGAQRWWLHHSLSALATSLEESGSKLILRRGIAAEEIARLSEELGTRRVHALRHFEPWWRRSEEQIARTLDLCLHDGNQLVSPGRVVNGSGGSYRIYTPFWRALQQHLPPPEPEPVPKPLPSPPNWPASEELETWRLLPSRPNWAAEFGRVWRPGEEGAAGQLEQFASAVGGYVDRRNLPSEEGTSRLSPHLHHGEVSPASVYHRAVASGGGAGEKFVKELAWRDFTQNVMTSTPDIGERHARPAFDDFPWRRLEDAGARADFEAWTGGKTGYPIVDAGMRQLWRIGWIHNRVRMIVASFLVKHLLIDWREGAAWFWDTLVDADYGNNSINWQWIAGTGFDSNHFSRIMAPLVQSAKFDAASYIRAWVPELAGLGDEHIHDPDAFGVRSFDYPAKIIGHKEARARALAALAGRA
jgi:deoxyribodipyrimidine photo-lyase